MDDFKPLFEYVEKNIENKIELKELADFMGYSPFYISRKFVDIYGIPITGYVRIRKLQYSIKDLLDGMKVIDVAMKYSFESHEGFSRSFKSLFGSSPKNIRNYLQFSRFLVIRLKKWLQASVQKLSLACCRII